MFNCNNNFTILVPLFIIRRLILFLNPQIDNTRMQDKPANRPVREWDLGKKEELVGAFADRGARDGGAGAANASGTVADGAGAGRDVGSDRARDTERGDRRKRSAERSTRRSTSISPGKRKSEMAL